MKDQLKGYAALVLFLWLALGCAPRPRTEPPRPSLWAELFPLAADAARLGLELLLEAMKPRDPNEPAPTHP